MEHAWLETAYSLWSWKISILYWSGNTLADRVFHSLIQNWLVHKVSYQQYIDGATARTSCPDGGKWIMELVRAIPSHTLQNVFCRRPKSKPTYVQESVAWRLSGQGHRWASCLALPPFGIWLNHPKGGSSIPYTTEPVLDTVEATVLEWSNAWP